MRQGPFAFNKPVRVARRGKIITQPCDPCWVKGVFAPQENARVKVPAGVDTAIAFAYREGEAGRAAGRP